MTTTITTSFDDALQKQQLRPLDVAFARLLADLDTDMAPALAWLAALLSRQSADGHLCLDLTQLDALANEQDWPPAWRALAATLQPGLPPSPLVADGNGEPANAPLVHDGTRLYLRRYWNAERAVARGVLARVASRGAMPASLGRELAALFPIDAAPGAGTASMPGIHWQRVACLLAARSGFGVITGGPGTGKTTTVVRLLALLQTLQPTTAPWRIRLAAPTGKAAARLTDSISRQLGELAVGDAVRASIPTTVTTLHRLLGARPDTRHFAHDAHHPLALDVLVIDEASMIDLDLMACVLDALPSAARLILIGDKNQLSSVEAGAVLGDLCRRADGGHYTAATAHWVREQGGDDIAAFVHADAQALDQCIAMLRHSYRFRDTSGIGCLAQAVNDGDVQAAMAQLQAPGDDLAWLPAGGAALDTLVTDGYRPCLDALRAQRPPAGDATAQAEWARHLLATFNRFQLLCALRAGPHGVAGMNQHVASLLHARGLLDADRGWYEGRPVLMTHNDYPLGLMNGDIGLCLRLADAQDERRLAVAFLVAANDGMRVRFVSPSRLPDVETAFALTVHKAQGSEFDHAALVLPPEPNTVLTRELLYTAITRARQRFSLVGRAQVVAETIAHRTLRHSGLAERLAASYPP